MFISRVNHIFDAICAPFSGIQPLAALALVSLGAAFVLLTAFKTLSNQEKIRYHKGKIFGHFLEIALFRDQFQRTVICQGKVLKHNLLYMRYFMTPILVMMVPMSIICLQIDYRLGSQPLEAGDAIIIQAVLDPATTQGISLEKVDISTSDNLVLESAALCVRSENAVFWRARLHETSPRPTISVAVAGGPKIDKSLATVAEPKPRFSPDRRKIKGLDDIIFSAEDPIAPQAAFLKLRTTYKAASYPFLFWEISPIVYFFILTMGFGLLLKPFMKVDI